MANKKVVIELPPRAHLFEGGDELERESLDTIADLVSVDSEEEFLKESVDADAIIVSWGIDITREIIAKLERCMVFGVGSVGTDMVDVEAATEAGIVVTNVPDVFIEEVADHTMMMLLGCARRVTQQDRMARDGRSGDGWPTLSQIPRLWGRALGIISFGNVGRAVARRAQVFGLHVIAYDPYVTELKLTAEGVEPVSMMELLERSDYVSMHPPHNEETERMMGAKHFAAMKDTAVLINCGRGPTVDEPALIEALDSGQIAFAGLDVLEKEPPDPGNPLLKMDNVILSPHVASATTRMRPESRRRVGRDVSLVLRGRWPLSCVNPTVLPRSPLERWQPYPMERGPNR